MWGRGLRSFQNWRFGLEFQGRFYSLHRQRHAKAKHLVAQFWLVPKSASDAAVTRLVEETPPAPAPLLVDGRTSGVDGGFALESAVIIPLPPVLRPFEDIAVDVVKPPRVG